MYKRQLKHTEEIALEKGLLSGYDDDYAKLAGDECRRVLSLIHI